MEGRRRLRRVARRPDYGLSRWSYVLGMTGRHRHRRPAEGGDFYSKPRRAKANRDLIATMKSHRANPDMLIIVIMQRLAQEDVTGFIQASKPRAELGTGCNSFAN